MSDRIRKTHRDQLGFKVRRQERMPRGGAKNYSRELQEDYEDIREMMPEKQAEEQVQ
jgi:hypothetical protein